MSTRIELPIDEIKELIEQGKTLTEIADIYFVSAPTVKRRLKEAGIDFKAKVHANTKPVPPKEELIALREKGLSVASIAKRYGCGLDLVYKWLRRYEFEKTNEDEVTEEQYKIAKDNGIERINVKTRYYKLMWSIEDAITIPVVKNHVPFQRIAQKRGADCE